MKSLYVSARYFSRPARCFFAVRHGVEHVGSAVANRLRVWCAIVCGVLAAVPCVVHAQSPNALTISTLAGVRRGSADGSGSTARFWNPRGLAVDGGGNVYVADTGNDTIRKITPDGVVTTLAGVAGTDGSTDGPGGSALFSGPQKVAVDTSGNVFVADTGNHTIRKIASGVVTTIAGRAGSAGIIDGVGGVARFRSPAGLAVDSAGNIFVSDTGNHTLRKIAPDGTVTTVAGGPGASGGNDGPARSARFTSPTGIGVDGSGNVYVGDRGNSTIRVLSASGDVTTLAGLDGQLGIGTNGVGPNARFYNPRGVAVDSSGNVFVADCDSSLIRKIAPDRRVTTLAGAYLERSISSVSVRYGRSDDGPGANARFFFPSDVAFDNAGNLFVADTENGTIRKVTPAGVVSTLAGLARCGYADGPADQAQFTLPGNVVVDAAGNAYFADTGNSTIRRVTLDGVVTTIAGSGRATGYVNGTGSTARFNWPQGMAVDSAGNIYVADTGNHAVRRVTPAGVVSTFAGNGAAGNAGNANGAGTAARFNSPQGLVVDSSGAIYVADTGNHTIRKVTATGVVTTFAGLAGSPGSMDGTGSAARFSSPQSLVVDGSGVLYVLDSGNSTVRKITAEGVVTTFAGRAGAIGAVDGTGDQALFNVPQGIAIDGNGVLYVADTLNHSVRKITPARVVTTLAGQAVQAGSADGSGNEARFNAPLGIGADRSGNFYVADTYNYLIRIGAPTVEPRIDGHPVSQTASATGSVAFSVMASGSTLKYQWQRNGANIAGATRATFTQENVQALHAGEYTVAVSNVLGTVRSEPATLTVTGVSSIKNLAIRTFAGTGAQTPIVGFSVSGEGTLPLLIRGVGPMLSTFGVPGVLADPILSVSTAAGASVATNDNWSGDPLVISAGARIGAFSLSPTTSLDAALLREFGSGSYTAQINGVGGATGVALVEIYDAGETAITGNAARLANVSARTRVGTGGDILIAGFAVSGLTTKTVLIRAIGPTLATFGLTGVLADPKLDLYRGTTLVQSNDNWGGTAVLRDAYGKVGAFPLSNNSRDAALLVDLPPGSYTAQISGVGNTTGVALVEIYEFP